MYIDLAPHLIYFPCATLFHTVWCTLARTAERLSLSGTLSVRIPLCFHRALRSDHLVEPSGSFFQTPAQLGPIITGSLWTLTQLRAPGKTGVLRKQRWSSLWACQPKRACLIDPISSSNPGLAGIWQFLWVGRGKPRSMNLFRGGLAETKHDPLQCEQCMVHVKYSKAVPCSGRGFIFLSFYYRKFQTYRKVEKML